MPDYEVTVKSVAQIDHVACIRDTIPAYNCVGQLFNELMTYLGEKNVHPQGYCAAIWHDPGFKEKDVDAEVMASVPASLEGNERIKVKQLPPLDRVAAVIHRGTYSTLKDAYDALMQWIMDRNYQISGLAREIYIEGGDEPENPNYITEIQMPVISTTGLG